MSKRAAILAGALIGGLVLLWWLLRSRDSEEEELVPPDPGLRYDIDKLESLPGYRPAKDGVTRFETHADFVRAVDTIAVARFPGKASRAIVICHAALGGGWHVRKPDGSYRIPLYHWNLWGQTCNSTQIAKGVSFTILKPKLSKEKIAEGKIPIPQAFRAFSDGHEALFAGYVANVDSYDTGGIEYLDGRTGELTFEMVLEYLRKVKIWFKKAERSESALKLKAGKYMWIYKRHLKGKLL